MWLLLTTADDVDVWRRKMARHAVDAGASKHPWNNQISRRRISFSYQSEPGDAIRQPWALTLTWLSGVFRIRSVQSTEDLRSQYHNASHNDSVQRDKWPTLHITRQELQKLKQQGAQKSSYTCEAWKTILHSKKTINLRIFSRFDRTLACDGQTDRHTHTAIASTAL